MRCRRSALPMAMAACAARVAAKRRSSISKSSEPVVLSRSTPQFLLGQGDGDAERAARIDVPGRLPEGAMADGPPPLAGARAHQPPVPAHEHAPGQAFME